MNFPDEKLSTQIKQFFDYFRTEKVFPEIVYQSCYDLLLLTKLNLPNWSGKNSWECNLTLDSYRNFGTIEELEAAFTKTLLGLIQALSPDSTKTEKNIIHQIKYYVEKSYGQDLSLDTVANKFFISKYRLSRLFKKETGENYWDFVTRIRMEKALFLLNNTNLKTYEVALKVGYDDICYFSTLFKKFFGKSPRNFRKNTGEDSPQQKE